MLHLQILTPSSLPVTGRGSVVFSVNLSIAGGFVFPNSIEEMTEMSLSPSDLLEIETSSGIRAIVQESRPVLLDGCCWTPAVSLYPGGIVSVIRPSMVDGLILSPETVTVVRLFQPKSRDFLQTYRVRLASSKSEGDPDTNVFFVGNNEKGGFLVHGD